MLFFVGFHKKKLILKKELFRALSSPFNLPRAGPAAGKLARVVGA